MSAAQSNFHSFHKTQVCLSWLVMGLSFLLATPAISNGFPYASDKQFKELILKNYPVGSDVDKLIDHLKEIGMTQEKDKIKLARLNRGISQGIDFFYPISEEDISKFYTENLYRFDYESRYLFWKIDAHVIFYFNEKDNSVLEYYQISRNHFKR